MFLSLKIVNSASIDALMSHSPLRDIIRRRFLFIPAGMKRKDMYSTVHFHVSSFVHVHFSINMNPQLNSIISSSAFRIPVLLERTFDMSSFMISNTPSDCMDLSILMRIPSGDRRSFLASSFSLS